MEPIFSHINEQGEASMVDISGKPAQERIAIAEGRISLSPQTLKLIRENGMKKGDVLSVARIAGIQAAKSTAHLIPLCHTLLLQKIEVNFEQEETGIKATALAKCAGQTGVEMEALTAASIALLTIYDMCKAVDKEMAISGIKLVEKTKKTIEP